MASDARGRGDAMAGSGIEPDDYLGKEIDHLRRRFTEIADQVAALERYALLATGAIWSWCVSNADAPGTKLLVWAPFVMTQLFGLRAWGLGRTLRLIRRYLVAVEATVPLPDGLGWQRYLAREPSRSVQWLTGTGFWVLLSLVTLAFTLFFGRLRG
jgi:hypothetical protein